MQHYWDKVLEEVLNKHDLDYHCVYTNLKKPVKKHWRVREARREPTNSRVTYPIGKNYPNVYFTKREAQVMMHLLKGKTIENVAITLGISKRTVEFYIKKMREKLNVGTKPELIEAICDSELLQHIDF